MDKQILLTFLQSNCSGHDNAKTGAYLRVAFNCRDVREVQETIEALRKDGYPIMSNCSIPPGPPGYFYPVSKDEAITYLQPIKNHIAHTQDTYRNLLDGLDHKFGMGA
jgi:hypothetical protein